MPVYMKDLRIVIVSWNVREELERCLSSLPAACGGLDYDVVIADNGSTDGTRDMLEKLRIANYKLQIFFNDNNRGFARACNQGLAGLDARYVLLLNPDTECLPGSLTALVRRMDEHPENIGIAGPKLLNSDRTHQPSVRRFPGVWDQAGIMLKLHRVFGRAKVFRSYFHDDFDPDRERDADQVMGACFLIRRELIEDAGGFDERYFIWFEEVDYCRTAIQRGWRVRFIPSASVIHHGGSSFAKVFSLKKQKMFNESLVRYFRKWQPGWQAAMIRILQPLSLLLSWIWQTMAPLFHGSIVDGKITNENNNGITRMHSGQTMEQWNDILAWFITVLSLEFISVLTIFRDDWNAIAIIAAGLAVGVISYKRPTLGIAVILLELLIGSKGYLLQLWGWPGVFSLRMILFACFLAGWSGNFIMHGNVKRLAYAFWDRKEWVLLFLAVAYGAIRGALAGNEFLFADANAWGFLLLLFPVLDLAQRQNDRLRGDVLPVLFAGPMWLAVKTVGLEYLFSHGFPSISPEAYLWVRRTGVGEVTLMTANAFRIFMQSYIWYVPALIIGASWILRKKIQNPKSEIRNAHGWLIAAFVVLGISLSRSIWIGCMAGLIALGWFYRKELLKSRRLIGRIILDGVIALAAIFAILAFPLPRVDVASLGELFGSRASAMDDAAVSRWNLLPVIVSKIKEAPVMGHGFGATVTYETKDPRILAQNPDGMYTTYAFEWGWLEHWVKLGVIGFGIVLFLVYRLLRRTWALQGPKWLVYGVFASLVGIAVTHVFSPYFNHPLGLGMLLAVEGWLTCSELDIY
jgi:GT2 family glycosyltransferase